MDLHDYACSLEFALLSSSSFSVFTIIASHLLQVLGSSGLKIEVEVPVD